MSEHAALLESAELYALGGLAEPERARFLQHMADGCAECEAALRANLDVAAQLLLAAAPVAPSSALRERLLARVEADLRGRAPAPGASAPRSGRAGSSPLARVAALAAGLLLLGSLGLAAYLVERLGDAHKHAGELEELLAYEESISWALVRELEGERASRVASERRLQGLSRLVAAIEAPLARSLALAGQGEFHRAWAKAYIEPASGRLILYAHNLPPVPDGRTYQIWVSVGERSQSVGVFQADRAGEAKYDGGRLPDIDGPVAVAVTLEPEGGAEEPTGPIVLAGS